MQPSYKKEEETHQQQQQHQYIQDFSLSILSTSQTHMEEFMKPKTHQFFSPQNHNFLPFYRREKEEENPEMASFDSLLVKSKLGLDENNMNREGVLGGEDDDLVNGGEQYIPPNQPCSLEMQPHCWDIREDSAFKQPFWKPSYTELLNSYNKGYIEGEDEREFLENNYNKQNGNGVYYEEVPTETEQIKNIENKCRLFGDLESIYGRPMPKDSCLPINFNDFHQLNSGVGSFDGTNSEFDHQSEAEEVSCRELRKREKRKKLEGETSSITEFIEKSMKQLVDHQEGLHKKFLETIEKLEQEKKEREEAWRRQQLDMFQREAIARAHDQALASSREATIVSCLEKITGKTINLPSRKTSLVFDQELKTLSMNKTGNMTTRMNKRWPKAEVEALIRICVSLEPKFNDSRLRLTVWEEMSNSMGSFGYQRSAQNCKEKWDNINRYYRKVKENSEQFPHKKHKSCSYFYLLDQFYSCSFINGPSLLAAAKSADLGFDGLSFNGFVAEKIQGVQEQEGSHGKDEENCGVFREKDEDSEEVDEQEEDEGNDCYSNGCD